MKKLIALILIFALILTTAVACAAPDEYFDVFAVVTAWEDADEGAQEIICTTCEGEIWAFYADAGDFSVGSLLRLRIWIPEEEIVDVEEIGFLSPAGMFYFLR